MYLIFIVLLFTLAVTDLVVGVSNDAVNFLNSAVGSRAGSRKIILLVAALGVLAGAMFSSGIMEVARKGIFNPQMFTFSEVMVIFVAVMLADILLLDVFNTFGMPTSTTVSIVFDLLGAAVIVSILKLMNMGHSLTEIGQYINSSKAIAIISGIFLSVIVAFIFGIVGQFFSRLLFSFHYKKRLKKYGGVWGGVSLTILSYFLLIKGVKGASFMPESAVLWIDQHNLILLLASFVLWTTVFQLLVTFTRIHILRVIVLMGTFSLAMAFASNDLVNFIGVPLAGLESYRLWGLSGENSDLIMTGLSGEVYTPSYLLLIAGSIMVVTLWRSRKARKVTATEVNLARQGEGSEKFKSNRFVSWLVRFSTYVVDIVADWIPKRFKAEINKKYIPKTYEGKKKPPAFDLVRASVNLTLASMLISIATLHKLPLSTTFVSFMVAMGTSLSDKAWGRSAEYRIAGVFSVVGGWFLTALIAFVVAGTFAFVIFEAGMAGVIGLVVLLIVVIAWSTRKHLREYVDEDEQSSVRMNQTEVPELNKL
ncbi:MAG: inorganic phosphate transporter [Cyclobacteriaceae bacterium]|nr:inorganic phosphate transporter [Cyclobacteriaceae bacterium]